MLLTLFPPTLNVYQAAERHTLGPAPWRLLSGPRCWWRSGLSAAPVALVLLCRRRVDTSPSKPSLLLIGIN